MAPLRNNDFEFESLKSFDVGERCNDGTGKKPQVTVTTAALPSSSGTDSHFGQQPGASSPILRFVDKWWIFELLAWIGSAASLVSIVAILQVHHGHPTPKWAVTIRDRSVQITINTVISLFATVMKSSLMVPVAAAISQLKWNWFYQGRPLTDFQLFDSAKGGPLGAIMLLWSFRGRSLVCLGGVIVIISLAIDPFIQNLVAYPQLPITVGQCTMPRTNAYSEYSPGVMTGLKSVELSMLGAIYTGIFDTESKFDVSPVCPTGNCTWAPYTSVGVCSKCLDTTSTVSKSCSTYEYPTSYDDNGNITSYSPIAYCNYTLPDDGPSISGLGFEGYVALNASSIIADMAMNISSSTSFPGMANPISVLNAIQGTWTPTSQTYQFSLTGAAQCALFFCVNRYEANVTKGVLHETLLSTWHNNSATIFQADGSIGDISLQPPSSITNGSTSDSEFMVLSASAQALSFQLQDMWYGNVSLIENGANSYSSSSDIVDMMYLRQISKLPRLMSNLAKSITKNMRNVDTSQPATGAVRQDVPFVLVRWQWIALPCILELLTLVFLIGTMADSARRGAMLWKSSSLATFYHPLTHDGRTKLGTVTHPREMEKTAAEMAVKWERTDHGFRLVQS